MPLGSTPEGRNWCIKALHPSDPLTEVRGIPDHSAVPSLLMNYQATFVMGPAAGATGTWSFDSTLLPHPIDFLSYTVTDSTGATSSEFDNPQIDGADHSEKYIAFAKLAQRWRLAYCSVTVHQDGPALSNQGSIVVSQPPVQPFHYPQVMFNEPLHLMLMGAPAELYSAEDLPDFTTSQSMPNAYFARSKDGVYVPLKLTETCQKWTSDKDAVSPAHSTFGGGTGNFLMSTSGATWSWPHWLTEDCEMNTVAGTSNQVRTSPMLNDTMAHICAENLSVDTRFTFFFRFGIEMQVSPSSALAPQLKLSPGYDAAALDNYFAIARELKDAYPADYNDLGKIWDSISTAVRNVLPVVRQLGPYGQAASMIGSGVLDIGDNVRQRRQRRRGAANADSGRGNPPRAAVERAQKAQSLKDAVDTKQLRVKRTMK